MKKIESKEFKEIIQSGHLNILLGSGCSSDYIRTLKDIEIKMNDDATRYEAQKDYYSLILKSKAILDEDSIRSIAEKDKLIKTKQNYDRFLGFWANIISSRSLHIVNKQVNLFTTNFDQFIEDSCERLGIPYNDGFSGQIKRIYNTANFNRILKYKSLQYDNTSDIPLFNIYKMHGSISWKPIIDEIHYSDGSHIPNNLMSKRKSAFENGYKKIPLINPNAEKHFETILDTNYASLLRKFTLELEKENSVLIIIGFSLNDKHIKNLLYNAMKTNPTLVVIYFSYSQYDPFIDKLEEKKYPNLFIISTEITKSKFESYVGNETTWEMYVKDKTLDKLVLKENIKSILDALDDNEKLKVNKVICQSFEVSTEYLEKVFSVEL